MNSREIRETFLRFFADHDHERLPSAPLVTHGDPTLLFANAGMVPFKDRFLGLETPSHPRAVTSQKCLRVSGKHNDLENVGPSPRHHTFFEMLGNFSFGDYFKEDAIRYAWALVTEGFGLDPAVLYATVFHEDDEAFELWRSISGLPAERIHRCGEKDNFWAMGETGPCGPCSEIFVDMRPDEAPEPWETGSENGRYLEIWNLVFMQFNRGADGALQPLAAPSIDTGSGLERVAAVLQGVQSNYDTDLFQPILRAAAALAGAEVGRDADADVSLRVIADHLRAVSFLLADGVVPGPDGRGYVLRRLLRRAVRHGMRLGFEDAFLHRLVPVVGEVMDDAYPELAATRGATVDTVKEEEAKYLATRATGAKRIQQAIDAARRDGRDQLDGDTLFDLYETYGQDLDSVREIAEEEQLGVDVAGYEAAFARQRARSQEITAAHQSRMASLREALGAGDDGASDPTPFLGYGQLTLHGVAVARLARFDDDGRAAVADALAAGDTGVAVLERTVFYAESGGQVGDVGRITWDGGAARVEDTQKDAAGVIFHTVTVESGTLRADAAVDLAVDADRRRAVERNHTATHLLHAALRDALGDGVRQSGSLVAPDRLRFDFTHGRPMTPEERTRVEDAVNAQVQRASSVVIAERSYDDAVEAGAMALFGEKYGDVVRTVDVPGYSLELCGGCHVRSTGEIGLVQITQERGVASGVRRIEAISGEVARAQVRREHDLLRDIAEAVGAPPERAADEVASLRAQIKSLEKELAAMRRQLVTGGTGGGGQDEAQEIAGVKLLVREAPGVPAGELRGMADALRDKLGSGVVVLASAGDGDKVALVVTVSKDLTGRVKAGALIKALAGFVGGRGGGRPDFAQAGGRDPKGLPTLIAEAPKVLANQLG
ncbi:MAG: alanine--tRNA ligase [Acidobacteriota bacterium]